MREIIRRAAIITGGLALMAMTACTADSQARGLAEERQEEIQSRMQDILLERTNFSPAEAGAVWEALKENETRIKCSQYWDWKKMAMERHETAHVCQVRLQTKDPLQLEISASYWVYMALGGTKYPIFGDTPIIDSQIGNVRIYDYRQGILAGETRKPGTWRMEAETQ